MTAHTDTASTATLTVLEEQTLSRPSRSLWRDAWHRLLRNRAAVLGVFVILFFMIVALFAPLIAPHNPLQINSGKDYLPPAWQKTSPTGQAGDPSFPLGTDNLGRDLLSRVIYGARVSMLVGFVPVVIILVTGISVGLFAGYRGGRTDNLMMRLADIDLRVSRSVVLHHRDDGAARYGTRTGNEWYAFAVYRTFYRQLGRPFSPGARSSVVAQAKRIHRGGAA